MARGHGSAALMLRWRHHGRHARPNDFRPSSIHPIRALDRESKPIVHSYRSGTMSGPVPISLRTNTHCTSGQYCRAPSCNMIDLKEVV